MNAALQPSASRSTNPVGSSSTANAWCERATWPCGSNPTRCESSSNRRGTAPQPSAPLTRNPRDKWLKWSLALVVEVGPEDLGAPMQFVSLARLAQPAEL